MSRGFRAHAQRFLAEKAPGAALVRLAQEHTRDLRFPSSRAAILALLVASAANRGTTYQSEARLAQLAQCCPRTVVSAIADLEENGLVSVERRQRQCNVYHVHAEQRARAEWIAQNNEQEPGSCRWLKIRPCRLFQRRHPAHLREGRPVCQRPAVLSLRPCSALFRLQAPSPRLCATLPRRSVPRGFPTVAAVDPTGPAAEALRTGDVVLSVGECSLAPRPNGERPTPTLTAAPVTVTVYRQGETLDALILPRFSIRLQRLTLGVSLTNLSKSQHLQTFRSAKIAHTGTPESLVPKEPDSLPHCPPQRQKPHLGQKEQKPCQETPSNSRKHDPIPEQNHLGNARNLRFPTYPTPDPRNKKPEIFQEKRAPGQRPTLENMQPIQFCALQTQENPANGALENAQTAQNADDRNHETRAERELRVVAHLRSRWEPIFSRSTPAEISVLLRAALKRARYRAYRPDLEQREHDEAEIERAWIEQEITEREGED